MNREILEKYGFIEENGLWVKWFLNQFEYTWFRIAIIERREIFSNKIQGYFIKYTLRKIESEKELREIWQSLTNEKLMKVVYKYQIEGTSFTTGAKKVFEFNDDEWLNFKKHKLTHYSGWNFNDSSIRKTAINN